MLALLSVACESNFWRSGCRGGLEASSAVCRESQGYLVLVGLDNRSLSPLYPSLSCPSLWTCCFYDDRFEHTWATIQWKQWRLRRRLRRGLDNSYVAKLPWYRRVFWALELPFILVRNATIPPVEADSWSQAQAAVRPPRNPVPNHGTPSFLPSRGCGQTARTETLLLFLKPFSFSPEIFLFYPSSLSTFFHAALTSLP